MHIALELDDTRLVGSGFEGRYSSPSNAMTFATQQPAQQPLSKEQQIAATILDMIANRGSVGIGDLLIVPDWKPEEVKQALAQLQGRGLITQTGNYYSLSPQGARETQRWGRSFG